MAAISLYILVYMKKNNQTGILDIELYYQTMCSEFRISRDILNVIFKYRMEPQSIIPSNIKPIVTYPRIVLSNLGISNVSVLPVCIGRIYGVKNYGVSTLCVLNYYDMILDNIIFSNQMYARSDLCSFNYLAAATASLQSLTILNIDDYLFVDTQMLDKSKRYNIIIEQAARIHYDWYQSNKKRDTKPGLYCQICAQRSICSNE